MAIASWEPLRSCWRPTGIPAKQNDHYTVDMRAFLKAFSNGKRWENL